jgi:hypothetical protein
VAGFPEDGLCFFSLFPDQSSLIVCSSGHRHKVCHENPVAELVMMADSMGIDMTDLFVEAGRDGSGMAHSMADTADLESTEMEH